MILHFATDERRTDAYILGSLVSLLCVIFLSMIFLLPLNQKHLPSKHHHRVCVCVCLCANRFYFRSLQRVLRCRHYERPTQPQRGTHTSNEGQHTERVFVCLYTFYVFSSCFLYDKHAMNAIAFVLCSHTPLVTHNSNNRQQRIIYFYFFHVDFHISNDDQSMLANERERTFIIIFIFKFFFVFVFVLIAAFYNLYFFIFFLLYRRVGDSSLRMKLQRRSFVAFVVVVTL